MGPRLQGYKPNKNPNVKELPPIAPIYDQPIGKKHACKKYDQFALNISSICGYITPVGQFHKIWYIKDV